MTSLSPEEVTSLHLKYHKSRRPADRQRLFEYHQPFASVVASRYVTPYFTYSESLNAALIGLWDALSRYSPAKGRFTTFSYFWMLKNIMKERGFLKHIVKLPHGDFKKNRLIRAAQHEGKTDSQIASMMGLTIEEFHRLEGMHEQPIAHPFDPTFEAVSEEESPADRLCVVHSRREILKDRLDLAMMNLTRRERIVVKGRHADPERTFKSLGREIGVTGEGARKLFAKAMIKLRKIS